MSNLLKQYYVVRQEDKKRVINSNGPAEEKIRKLAVGAQVPEAERLRFPGDSDGFSGGIAAQRIEPEPQPDPHEIAKQILDDAREQADQMMNEANAEANRLLADTREQAHAVFEEQKALGFTEGAKEREAELAKQEQELEDLRKQLLEEQEQKRTELESEFQLRMEELEGDIVDALIPVFDKIFHIELEGRREVLLALLNNTLMNVEVGGKVRIRTSEADKELLMEHLEEIREHAGNDVSIELLQDLKMEDGQCQLETSYGVFDCGIDTHFENLIKEIRSLV
ncbi:MAG: FliH/SctL family protein [Blautia sp.]|nr:FliH/SctL family protein [Blautia sp.]